MGLLNLSTTPFNFGSKQIYSDGFTCLLSLTTPFFCIRISWSTSAARKFEQKVAKFLKTPKDLHQSNLKISKDLHQRPPKIQKYLQQSSENHAKNLFKQVFMTIFEK